MDKSEAAFKKYIDALLDLMLPDSNIVNHYGNRSSSSSAPMKALPSSWSGRP
jgi:hypothetical protein